LAERNLSIHLSMVDGGKVKAELSELGEKEEGSRKEIEAAATPASGGLKLLSSAANNAEFQLAAATEQLGLRKRSPSGILSRLGAQQQAVRMAGDSATTAYRRLQPVTPAEPVAHRDGDGCRT